MAAKARVESTAIQINGLVRSAQSRVGTNGNHDQNAAHGGRAGFFLVILWAFFANVLADLKFAQAIDDERPDDQSGKQGSQAGESGAKREIAENTERRKIMKEF